MLAFCSTTDPIADGGFESLPEGVARSHRVPRRHRVEHPLPEKRIIVPPPDGAEEHLLEDSLRRFDLKFVHRVEEAIQVLARDVAGESLERIRR